MKGLRIFTHSVRQVFGNLGAAVRVAGLLLVAQGLIYLSSGVPSDPQDIEALFRTGGFPWGWVALLVVVSIVANLWIAVGWHRYVLRVEEPGVVAPFHGDRMLAYLGKSLLITLIVMVAAAVLSFVAGFLFVAGLGQGQEPGLLGGLLFGLIVYLPVMVIFYRFSPALPAAALGEPLGLGEAWSRTAGASGPILVAALCVLALSIVADTIGGALFGGVPAVWMLWSFLTYAALLMIGISILTTLYGHYVEGRDLV